VAAYIIFGVAAVLAGAMLGYWVYYRLSTRKAKSGRRW
jgi:hypothetical protein